MKRTGNPSWALLLVVVATISWMLGCNSGGGNSSDGNGANPGQPGAFTLAWSEYPSWSVYGVAHEAGLIDKNEGKQGSLEEKWGVDVVLQQLSYDACLTAYGNSTIDAVCITNMDVLAPAGGRNSIAILPTSTSDGADACIGLGIESVDALKEVDSYGLEKSVSQYMFERALEELGHDPKEFPFRHMDPEKAAQAMQTKQPGVQSIVVWNPFVMQTLGAMQGEAQVLFDSTKIPEEIVDMVVIGEDALNRPGGQAFANCIVDAFYEVNRMLSSPSQGDETLTMLGKNFAGLSLDDMQVIVQQTKFYKTPEAGLGLFQRPDFKDTLMPRVINFCATHDIAESPTVSFDDAPAQLRFDTSFMTQQQQSATAP